MKFNKELLYHMTCEKCNNWWSYPSTTVANFQNKTWYCPHCGHEHKPPHVNKVDEPDITLSELRALV